MTNSYLYSICDFHINYAGCGSYARTFQLIDYVTGSLYVISAFGYLGILPLQLFRSGLGSKPISKIWARMDTICLLAPIVLIFRAIFAFNTSITAAYADNPEQFSDSDIETTLKISVIADYMFFLVGAVTLSLLVFTLVEMASSASLYQKMNIRGRDIEVGKILKYVRLVNLIILTVFAALWQTWG
ncbi:hypothetical protein HDV01_003368 [Terramyces sp. JEL0728]|nr:hypothetical protein HDV01_003368 [Terramyces sp. JEL0728]